MSDIVRQWQGWLAMHAIDRWLDIVSLAFHNMAPLNEKLTPTLTELTDYARTQREGIRVVAIRLIQQITEVKRWWFKIGSSNIWESVRGRRASEIAVARAYRRGQAITKASEDMSSEDEELQDPQTVAAALTRAHKLSHAAVGCAALTTRLAHPF